MKIVPLILIAFVVIFITGFAIHLHIEKSEAQKEIDFYTEKFNQEPVEIVDFITMKINGKDSVLVNVKTFNNYIDSEIYESLILEDSSFQYDNLNVDIYKVNDEKYVVSSSFSYVFDKDYIFYKNNENKMTIVHSDDFFKLFESELRLVMFENFQKWLFLSFCTIFGVVVLSIIYLRIILN